MFYYVYSKNRIFFLNEYWILIPTVALADYFIIRKIRSRKEEKKALRNLEGQLKDQIEQEKKLRRILILSLGLNGCAYFLPRGGEDFLNFISTEYLQCGIEEGLRFLDDNRLKSIILSMYRSKSKGGIIFITVTALCQLARLYGDNYLAFPLAIGEIGSTAIYQTCRKILISLILGGVGPLWYIGNPVTLMSAFMLTTYGLRLAFTDLDSIPTSSIYDNSYSCGGSYVVESIKPRLPKSTDVVVVNNKNRNKMIMSNQLPGTRECWLPDQALLNSNCKVKLKSTEIPNAIDLVSPNLKYEEVVNMRDVTSLDKVDFSDLLDLGEPKKSSKSRTNTKMVKFLDLFRDSGTIDKDESWDTLESAIEITEKRYLRGRNKL